MATESEIDNQTADTSDEESKDFRFARARVLASGIGVGILLLAIVSLKIFFADLRSVEILNWQFVALLGIMIFCFSLPLIKEVSFSKDGASISIKELDKKVGASAIQLSQQLDQVTKQLNSYEFDRTKNGPTVEMMPIRAQVETISTADAAPSANAQSSPAIVTVREAIKMLPPPTDEDDPQKGRFGGKESTDTRRLSAKILKSTLGKEWRKVVLILESTDGRPLTGSKAFFFLHDTFSPEVCPVNVADNAMKVSLSRQSYGGFTAGVLADDGKTKLEIDLQTTPNIDAPRSWRDS